MKNLKRRLKQAGITAILRDGKLVVSKLGVATAGPRMNNYAVTYEITLLGGHKQTRTKNVRASSEDKARSKIYDVIGNQSGEIISVKGPNVHDPKPTVRLRAAAKE